MQIDIITQNTEKGKWEGRGERSNTCIISINVGEERDIKSRFEEKLIESHKCK